MPITDDIKSRLDLVSYIERHVPSLKKSGRYLKAKCPFHDDRTPSFVVNPDRGTWRCYGACAEGGDLFTFYQKIHNVDFRDALKALADEANIEIPQYSQKQQVNQKQARQLALLDDLASRYHKLLTEYDGAQFVRDYLDKRNIHDDSIQQWRLGYAPGTNIIPKLLKKGYRSDDLLELGIAYKHESGQLQSRFYNRLMIPIMDGAGQVVGFGARQLDRGQQAKYVNSHESDLFQKSHLLYGWHVARKAARWAEQLVIVEGYMDVIQAHQYGYTNVTAQMGTSLTDEQIQHITDAQIETLILCLDGDDGGQQGTTRAIDNLINHAATRDIRIIQIPEGYDPDDLIQADGWEDAIDEATPVIDYLIDRAVSQLPDSPSLGQRHAVANQLIPKLYQLDSNTGKLWSVQQLATALGLNALALADMAHKLMTSRPQPESQAQPPPAPVDEHPIESYVIYCLMQRPDWYWTLIGDFDKLHIQPLDRTDFAGYGDVYWQIQSAIEGDSAPADVIDLDLSSDLAPEYDALLMNAVRVRLNHIQRTMDELAELRDIEAFSTFLAQRTHLTQQLAEIC